MKYVEPEQFTVKCPECGLRQETLGTPFECEKCRQELGLEIGQLVAGVREDGLR